MTGLIIEYIIMAILQHKCKTLKAEGKIRKYKGKSRIEGDSIIIDLEVQPMSTPKFIETTFTISPTGVKFNP